MYLLYRAILRADAVVQVTLQAVLVVVVWIWSTFEHYALVCDNGSTALCSYRKEEEGMYKFWK